MYLLQVETMLLCNMAYIVIVEEDAETLRGVLGGVISDGNDSGRLGSGFAGEAM